MDRGGGEPFTVQGKEDNSLGETLLHPDRASPTDNRVEYALLKLDEQVHALSKLVHSTRHQRNVTDLEWELEKAAVLRKKRVPVWVTRYLIIWSILWQVGLVLMLHFLEGSRRRSTDAGIDAGMGFMLAGQGLHLVLVLVLSVKIVKQAMHLSLSIWFLVQSYLSTILLFAGAYLCVYRLNPYSFSSLLYNKDISYNSIETPLIMWSETLYFSVSNMSTVGTADLHPRLWYTRLLVCIQMLTSVVYTVGIFSMGIGHYNRAWRLKDRANRYVGRGRSGSSVEHTSQSLPASVLADIVMV